MVFKGSPNILEERGFIYNGDFTYYKTHIDPLTKTLHELKIKYEHFRPIDCIYDRREGCFECPNYSNCYKTVTNPVTNEKTYYTRFQQKFSAIVTEDSNPDQYLLNLLDGYLV